MGSGHAQDQFSVWQANRDYGRGVMNRGYQAGLAMMDAAGQNKAGQANFWLTDNNAYNFGVNTGKIAQNTQAGNLITSANYPNVAQQQVQQSDLQHRYNVAGLNLGYDQIKNAHELLPSQHELNKTTIGNQQYDASNYQPNKSAARAAQMQQQEFDNHRLIAEMMNAQTPGSGTTYLMGVKLVHVKYLSTAIKAFSCTVVFCHTAVLNISAKLHSVASKSAHSLSIGRE